MANAGDSILVHFVDRLEIGAVFRRSESRWPVPHITLVPWFKISDSVETLTNDLGDFTTTVRPFVARLGAQVLFGKDGEVPVNVIVNQEVPRQLHKGLLSVVQQHAKLSVSTEWLGDAYQAHVTKCQPGGPAEGDRLWVDQVSLVSLADDEITCRLDQNFALGGLDEAAT